MTNEPPNEVWVNEHEAYTYSDSNRRTIGGQDMQTHNKHRYILASRVEKMIRLAVLEERRIQQHNLGDATLSVEFFDKEINQLRKELE